MDYTYDGKNIFIESTEYSRKQQICRIFLYYVNLLGRRLEKAVTSEDTQELNKDIQGVKFWDKEIDFEQKVYTYMKRWEIRHPIMGIILSTILGGILVSLLAGIILEAVMKLI